MVVIKAKVEQTMLGERCVLSCQWRRQLLVGASRGASCQTMSPTLPHHVTSQLPPNRLARVHPVNHPQKAVPAKQWVLGRNAGPTAAGTAR